MAVLDRAVALARVVGSLGSAATANEVADVLLDGGLAALGASAGIVAALTDEGRTVRTLRVAGFERPGPETRLGPSWPIEAHAALSDAIRERRTINLPTPAERETQYPEFAGWEAIAGDGLTVALPLTSAGSPLGALGLVFPTARLVDAERLDYFAAVAVAAGQALDRIRLQGVEHRARMLSEALARMSAAAAAAATPADVAAAFVEQALPATGAERGSLYVLVGDHLELIATLGYPEAMTGAFQHIAIDAPLPSAAAVRGRQPILLRTAEEIVDEYPSMTAHITELGHRAFVSVPMLVRGETLGTISLGFQDERAVTDEVVAFLRGVADVAAQALARARLYDEATSALTTLEAVVEHMPIGVLVAGTADRRILFQNTRAEAILGRRVRSAEATEDAGIEAFHVDGRPLPPDAWPLTRTLASGEVVTGEHLVIRQPDGSHVEIAASAAPVTANGAIVGGVMAMTDVTAEKEAEALRDAFLGVLAHELRTPVTTIYGGAATLLRRGGRADGTSKAILADVAAESERLYRLVENLLVLARAERGAVVAERDPLSIVRAVPRIVDEERGRWPITQFELDLDPDLPIVAGDEAHLRLVLSNLLSNAAKYGPPNGRVLVVGRRSEDGREVLIQVFDDGPGVDESEVDSLFRAFFRSPSTIRKAPGSGIGLFIVRALVEAMNGRVWSARRPEGGAEFGFALPAFEDVDPEV